MCYWKHHISCCFIIIITICQVVSGWKFPGVSMISLTDQIFWDRSWPVTQKTGQQLKTSQNCSKTGKWQGFFCRRRDRFDPVVFTSLIYPPIVSPSNGQILSKLALFERQWMATLSVGREEMYTQPVSAERIRPIKLMPLKNPQKNYSCYALDNHTTQLWVLLMWSI